MASENGEKRESKSESLSRSRDKVYCNCAHREEDVGYDVPSTAEALKYVQKPCIITHMVYRKIKQVWCKGKRKMKEETGTR